MNALTVIRLAKIVKLVQLIVPLVMMRNIYMRIK
jgi:hypothetical protein